MPKELERDLGLYATVTLSFGAMAGIGIFVLPGLAFKLGGPAVLLAYLLAGVAVLPAALSKAEMATAMPEAGGTYLYIDRAMGPLLGTIAGLGAWFSLAFKSAFALVGLGAYMVLFLELPVIPVALGLTGLVVLVNVVGVKQSGRFQNVVVSVVVVGLVVFVVDGVTFVDGARFHPFFGQGNSGLLATTGFLFVGYAGVTKIASVAEEVENPGRNLPLGLLLSLGLMTGVYLAVVFVLLGVLDHAQVTGNMTAMAVAGEELFGPAGRTVVAVLGVLALVSLANAGLLGSSRFPFAMSRDELAPATLRQVHDRFHTPVVAILLTGGVMAGLIVFVPVLELAKLASAFKILVFSLVNVALVAFRESDLASYDPEFVSPGYPWIQLFGILAGLVLLTQMGPIPIAGAVGIIVAGVLWYRVYGRERTEREGAALDAIRRGVDQRALAQTETTLAEHSGNVLVALAEDTPPDREATMLVLAGAVASRRGGRVHAVMFESVPEQVSLSSAADRVTAVDRNFERQTYEVADTLPVPIEVEEVVAHDVSRAVVNHAREVDADVLMGEWEPEYLHAELLGTDVDWYMRNAPCDVTFVRDRGIKRVREVAVLTTRGPFSPRKVVLADAMAAEFGARVRFITAVDEDATTERLESTAAFHADLEGLCESPTASEVIMNDDHVEGLLDAAGDTDLAVMGSFAHTRLYDLFVGDVAVQVSDELDCTTVHVHAREPRRHTFLRSIIERVFF